MLPLEIYIHIPFCVRKCAYCDFLSGTSTEEEREAYVELLCREMEACPQKVRDYRVVSVFFGGGTPSLLTGEQVSRILQVLKKQFVVDENAEITMEMNPGTAKRERLEAYKRSGVNRLSIGLQSVHNEELNMLGRIHTYEDFLDSYNLARRTGFENINVDLISAIPGQTVESWEETLRTILELKPEHISAYSLIIEPGTPFDALYGEEGREGVLPLPDEEAERRMYHQTRKILQESGYDRYEISNYARPGYACRHNQGYWNRVPYLGFGIGAASLVPAGLSEHGNWCRYSNPETVAEYRTCFQDKFRGEPLERKEEMEEFMFLGLRQMCGIRKADFQKSFGESIEKVYAEAMKKLENLNLIEENEERIWLTEKGIDVSNMVFVEFML